MTKSIPSAIVSFFAFMMCVACIMWNIDLPTRIGVSILQEQYMSFQLGLALSIVFLLSSLKSKIKYLDYILASIALLVLGYATINFPDLLLQQAYRPPEIIVIGLVVVVLVMESIRRRTGWALFAIVLTFIVYALFADKVPGDLVGEALSLSKLVQYIGFDPSAVFSSPLAVGTIIVLLFVFFGQLLFAAGGGDFFTDLAMAGAGSTRGGSAKISILASGLFGSISGSAVSNVVTTGVVTIPLMQKGGYSKEDSGAIEAIASTGGQLTPPIMGAAAFLMAEFMEIPYMSVVVAAILPAVFYYFSVFLQVDLIAGRDNVSNVSDNQLTARDVLKQGWHFIIPFAILLFALFYLQYDPEDSALLASIAIVVVGFLRPYKNNRLSLAKLKDVFVGTGKSMVDLIAILAAAGFVIGVLNITGLGFALTLVLLDIIGGHFILLLVISAVICIFLGMGMPTTGVYILLAALVAPSLIEAGANPIAAHMFILYFGMMSMITPPVAIAAFAAATISGANQLATGLKASLMGWAAYIIPFVFIGTPTLLLEGNALEIVVDVLKTAIGIVAICLAVVGYFKEKLGKTLRITLLCLGAFSFPLGLIEDKFYAYVNIVSCLTIISIIFFMLKSNKNLKEKAYEYKNN